VGRGCEVKEVTKPKTSIPFKENTMSNATPSRLGQANGAGGTDALFLKVFSGEVMSSFNAKTVMAGLTRVRNITSGKSAQFPAIGRIGAEYHTPGAEILGSAVEHGEKVISIDDLLISSSFIANIDEAKNHYEVRSEYSKQMGAALAQTYDRQLIGIAYGAAVAGDTGAVADQGAAVVTNVGATPTVQTIVDAIYAEAAAMDALFLPTEDRFVLVSPATYWGLVQNDKLIDRDFGTNGSYADGTVMKVAGMSIIKSPNIGVNHTLAGNTADYPDSPTQVGTMVDTTALSALCFQRGALGTVKLMDLSTESDYDIRRQGTLMVAKMAVGHGTLRPEGIRALRAAA